MVTAERRTIPIPTLLPVVAASSDPTALAAAAVLKIAVGFALPLGANTVEEEELDWLIIPLVLVLVPFE